MSPSHMCSLHFPHMGRLPRAFWTESVHCVTSLPCCLRARRVRGITVRSALVSVCGLFPSPGTVTPFGSGFGVGAAAAGAALLELAAEALGVCAEALGVTTAGTGFGGTGIPFMSISACCVSASSMGTGTTSGCDSMCMSPSASAFCALGGVATVAVTDAAGVEAIAAAEAAAGTTSGAMADRNWPAG
eukprot:14254666-Alexandrium_andersonii.AAC.1